jgi:penicillin G amidase
LFAQLTIMGVRAMPGIAAAERDKVSIEGLEQPVEIIVDQWGIPHVYAGTVHDVFFAQGWNAGRERLWQLDLWRKRGLGRLAENFGPAYAAKDRAARLFLYRGDMDAEWAVYGADAKAWTEAFAAGLNAYIAKVLAGEAPLPVEFKLTDTRPEPWDASDVVRIRSHGISNNAEGESIRMRIVSAGGLAADRVRRKLEPDHALALPAGLDLSDIPADLLADYTLATKDVEFAPPGAAPAKAAAPAALVEEAAAGGSNNWAISGSRTATGRPILASDPHRVLVAPSIRYVIHLEAPGYKVMGAGELHLPGVTLGHNGTAAFGITIFPADHADFYVYELNPENPRQYRYDGGWEDMRVVTERIAVKGEADREVELAFTRHGPVLKAEPGRNRAFALRTAWTHPGTSAYFGAARYQMAADWPTFREALKHWGAAPMNFVYADVAGNIAWQPAGFIPRRKGWDGLMGAPGDGRYEWDGFIDQAELPTLLNPERGWIQTANELNVPADHPSIDLGIGYEWADPGRAERIGEVLDANDRMTVAQSAALQVDVVSRSALRALPLLAGLTSPDPNVQRAIDLLTGWDGNETLGSAPAAIAEVWLAKHLGRAVTRRVATPAAAAIIDAATTPSQYAAVDFLQSPGAELGPDPAAARREILLESLGSAVVELTGRLGPDMGAWRWGDLHHAHFIPAAAAFGDTGMKAKLSHGPTPVAGSAFTVASATYRVDDFGMTNGASVRMVMDVGEWDNSLVVNTPGQSGDPDSPHYSDLFPLWAKGEYVPMLWSRGAVEAAAERVIELVPG